MSIFRKKTAIRYNAETQDPAVRRSICTGEITVGFIDKASGKFHDYMCVHTQAELDEFCCAAGITDIKTIY